MINICSTVKYGFNGLFRHKNQNVKEVMEREVANMSRIMMLASYRFYAHVYNIVLNVNDEAIMHEFIQNQRTNATRFIPYNELEPKRKIEGFF